MIPSAKAALVPRAAVPIDLDFTDQALRVSHFADGMWTIEVDDAKLLIPTAQMQEVVGAFLRLGKEQGWT